MHWPLLCREQSVRKMGWVIKLQNHRNRENGQAVFEEVTGLKQLLLILVSFFFLQFDIWKAAHAIQPKMPPIKSSCSQ